MFDDQSICILGVSIFFMYQQAVMVMQNACTTMAHSPRCWRVAPQYACRIKQFPNIKFCPVSRFSRNLAAFTALPYFHLRFPG
jgi:hypothetical protein